MGKTLRIDHKDNYCYAPGRADMYANDEYDINELWCEINHLLKSKNPQDLELAAIIIKECSYFLSGDREIEDNDETVHIYYG